jgi:hypothetical protein
MRLLQGSQGSTPPACLQRTRNNSICEYSVHVFCFFTNFVNKMQAEIDPTQNYLPVCVIRRQALPATGRMASALLPFYFTPWQDSLPLLLIIISKRSWKLSGKLACGNHNQFRPFTRTSRKYWPDVDHRIEIQAVNPHCPSHELCFLKVRTPEIGRRCASKRTATILSHDQIC